ncbi:protein tyrosine phosphatase family protein [Alteriqipengyuania sp. 357]
MMPITPLDDNVSVTGQVAPEDMRAIAEQGFRSVICNRPDGEEPGQPAWAQVETAAREAGLETRFIPIASADDLDARKGDFATALDDMPGPILAFCRSGARSGKLYEAARPA